MSPDASASDLHRADGCGQRPPVTLSGTLTLHPTSAPRVSNQDVTFAIGSQSCDGKTQLDGTVSCTIDKVDQPVSTVAVTSTFTSDNVYVGSTSANPPTTMTVTQPTTLMVTSTGGDYQDATPVSGTLMALGGSDAGIPGELVTLSLDGNENCTVVTDAAGVASCYLTPTEPAGTYPLTATFTAPKVLNPDQALQLISSSDESAQFKVTTEETTLTYTGPTNSQNGQPLTLSANLSRTYVAGETPDGMPLGGKAVLMTLGPLNAAQSCTGTTDAAGNASCSIASVSQSAGPVPVTVVFAGDTYYSMANDASIVHLPDGTQVTVSSTTGTYSEPKTVSATLVDTNKNDSPIPGEQVTLAVSGTTQSCPATTDAFGVASCSITPNEPAGTYSLTATFPGEPTVTTPLASSSGSGTLTVALAPTTFTGVTSTPPLLTNGGSAVLSGKLTETTTGVDVPNEPVTFSIGSQSCTGTTDPMTGVASCTIASVNQTAGTVAVVASFSGDNDYNSSTGTSSPIPVKTPTRLTINAGSSDYNDAGTVSATLSNAANGAPIAGEPVTLTFHGQFCTAMTNPSGVASCSITPNEAAGTYTLTATFGGDNSQTPALPELLGTTGTGSYSVTLEETAITYTGPSLAVTGMPFTIAAALHAGIRQG